MTDNDPDFLLRSKSFPNSFRNGSGSRATIATCAYMTERASYKAACVLAVLFSKLDTRLSARSGNRNPESSREVDLRLREERLRPKDTLRKTIANNQRSMQVDCQ